MSSLIVVCVANGQLKRAFEVYKVRPQSAAAHLVQADDQHCY